MKIIRTVAVSIIKQVLIIFYKYYISIEVVLEQYIDRNIVSNKNVNFNDSNNVYFEL